MTLLGTVDIILAVVIGASLILPPSRGRSRFNVALAFILTVALLLSGIALEGDRS